MKDACLLLYLNKRDLPDALAIANLTETLGFIESCQKDNRKYHVQPTIATTGEGLHEGIEWLCENMIQL
jgi:hypothetical protein